jgi:hypothetical protein
MGKLGPLTFSVSVDKYVVTPIIFLSLLFKGLLVCSLINVILYLLAFSSPVVWYFLSFHGFVCFHFLCAGFLEDTFVVVAWWSYIDLVSAYHGKLLLLHLFFFYFYFIPICTPSILNDSFTG